MLNDKNYKVWSREALLLLTEQEDLDTITNHFVEPVEGTMTRVEYREAHWKYSTFLKRDAIGCIVLLGTTRNDIVLQYERFNSTRKV